MHKSILASMVAVIATTAVASAATPPEVAAEQPMMETAFVAGVGPLSNGNQQRYAQAFQLGWAATISHVMLPITCHPEAVVRVTIERTTAGVPDGRVLSTQDVPGYALDGVARWRMIELASEPRLQPGTYAFTVSAVPAANGAACSFWVGPAGDAYGGGKAYFWSYGNGRPVWSELFFVPGQARDLAFQLYARPL